MESWEEKQIRSRQSWERVLIGYLLGAVSVLALLIMFGKLG